MTIAPRCCSHSAVRGCRGLTWVWVIRADRAEQVFLSLVVDLAQQLSLLQDKLVALPQLPVAHAAAEAVQVVDALQSAHHELCGGDLLHAAAALGRKQPAPWEEKGDCRYADGKSSKKKREILLDITKVPFLSLVRTIVAPTLDGWMLHSYVNVIGCYDNSTFLQFYIALESLLGSTIQPLQGATAK